MVKTSENLYGWEYLYITYLSNSLYEYKNLDSKSFSHSTLKNTNVAFLNLVLMLWEGRWFLIALLFLWKYILSHWKLSAYFFFSFDVLKFHTKNCDQVWFFSLTIMLGTPGTVSFCGLWFFFNNEKFSAFISSKISFFFFLLQGILFCTDWQFLQLLHSLVFSLLFALFSYMFCLISLHFPLTHPLLMFFGSFLWTDLSNHYFVFQSHIFSVTCVVRTTSYKFLPFTHL